jgi:RNA polymerase sigma factor (sigma-70 family)
VITLEEENLLIDRILAGDRESYAVLVNQFKSYAFTIAFKILANRPDAEEAAQDAFIKAFHYLKSFNRQARFSTWLYRIVFNTAVSYKRKNRRHFQSIEDNIVEHGLTEHELEKKDKQTFVAMALDRLNEADRLAIQLYYIQEFSLEEVAGILEQNLNTVKVRVHRARLKLADELTRILKQEALTL